MAELKARREAYRTTVVYQLGCAARAGVRWKRTTVPTLDSDAAIRALAARLGIEEQVRFPLPKGLGPARDPSA
jgi:hypothetical protein